MMPGAALLKGNLLREGEAGVRVGGGGTEGAGDGGGGDEGEQWGRREGETGFSS